MSLGQGIVMIAAGAAAQHHSPARVIAVCGAIGAVAALTITLNLARETGRRQTDTVGAQESAGSAPGLAAHGRLPSSE
jgi:hypothetical protein